MNFEPPATQASQAVKYPPPPRVHWLVLLLVLIAVTVAVAIYAPNLYGSLLLDALADGWMLYVCLWIRRLNPHSNSIFWCAAYVVFGIGKTIASGTEIQPAAINWISDILGLASCIVGLVTIYTIRDELLYHYNEREPIGLHLGPVLTFFFSFLYFQSQLYEIAQYKKRQQLGIPPSLIS